MARDVVGPDSNLVTMGQRQEYTLNRTPVRHRTPYTQTFTYLYTPKDISHSPPPGMTQGEHIKLHIDSYPSSGLPLEMWGSNGTHCTIMSPKDRSYLIIVKILIFLSHPLPLPIWNLTCSIIFLSVVIFKTEITENNLGNVLSWRRPFPSG